MFAYLGFLNELVMHWVADPQNDLNQVEEIQVAMVDALWVQEVLQQRRRGHFVNYGTNAYDMFGGLEIEDRGADGSLGTQSPGFGMLF